MNFSATLFAPSFLLACNVMAVVAMLLAVRRVRWRALDGATAGAWAAACVLLAGMWLVRAGLQPGLSFHLLGAATFTLMMGAPLALLAMMLVLVFLVAAGQLSWLALGVNVCFTVLPAVLLVAGLLRLARRRLPGHFFVYVFMNAFFGGALSMVAASLCGMGLLWLGAVYEADYLLDNALPFYFLLSWSEAFTTGLVMSIMVVYRPQWVSTFDDDYYLGSS